MPYPVRYSTRAYIEYEEILEYVSGKYGNAVAVKVDEYFELIKYQLILFCIHILVKRKTLDVV